MFEELRCLTSAAGSVLFEGFMTVKVGWLALTIYKPTIYCPNISFINDRRAHDWPCVSTVRRRHWLQGGRV